MDMNKFKQGLLLGLMLLGFSSNGMALSIPPPFPGLAPDTNGSGLFQPAFRQTLNVEVFDILDGTPPPFGSEFGFYFAGNPTSLIPIFEADDLSSNTGFVIGEQAVIDFVAGWVYDAEKDPNDPNSFDRFTPQARGADIGFYWRQTDPDPNDPNVNGLTLFTQAALNPNGVDAASEFRYLSDPMTWAIVFGIPLPMGSASLLGIQVVDGLVPSPIPIPGAAGLWLLGLAGIAWFRRRLNSPAE